MNYPLIRIKNSFLLNGLLVPLLIDDLRSTSREHEAESSYIDQKVQAYTAAWSHYEEAVVPAMCDVLGLEFRQNIIDVYVAPTIGSFSDPMVVSSKYTDEAFMRVFVHELLHRLLTDNTSLPLASGQKISEGWQQLFGTEHEFKALVHIPVHAVLKYMYLDILNKPEWLENDIAFHVQHKPYNDAWTYVEAHDYKTIIAQLRDMYRK